MRRTLILAVLLAAMSVLACHSEAPDPGGGVDTVVDPDLASGDVASDVLTGDQLPGDLLVEDLPPGADAAADTIGPACDPGEGCFLDPCGENADCQSGWCVEHMGDAVCTTTCQEDCPAGWACQQVAGTDPDVVFICVSAHANLCKPCAAVGDCASTGGAEDVCVDYGVEGSFCGGGCGADGECPWGFSCQEVATTDGVTLSQCVADAGVCPCTPTSVALGLWTPCALESEWGACAGKRVCTDDGLGACDAATPAAETCNGLDDDCDAAIDEPLEAGGDYVNLCNDGNPCTTDSCDGETGCSHGAIDGGECVDGDPCTAGDHCASGACVGLPIICDDGDPCTDDACNGLGGCVSEFNGDPCDDFNPCTVGDHCQEGACVGFAAGCTCAADADCGPPDGNLCNGEVICDTGSWPYLCVVDPGTIVLCPPPGGPDAPCLGAVCDTEDGACGFDPINDGYACDDGDACTTGDHCDDGACAAGMALNCADDDPCTVDACVPGQGCVHTLADVACDDGDPCTVGDHCDGGVCIDGAPMACDDGNPCTSDACDPLSGCAFVPNASVCDDGNACTVGDHCAGGGCVFTGGVACDDGNLCTDDSCNPLSGCTHTLNAAPCDDEDLCTTGDHCHLGGCIAGGALPCNDQNPCTGDGCNAATGCQFIPVEGACDDGNACTEGDLCINGLCVGEPAGPCDDGNPCTDDSCKPLSGCTFTPNVDLCDDEDPCTLIDVCAASACVGSGAPDCDDGNPCTDDLCTPGVGCAHMDNADPCDDLDACTTVDACVDGACIGSGALACDDGVACTADSCQALIGCVYTPISPCCGNGVTEPGEFCDDGNTQDGDDCPGDCSSITGCSGAAEYHYQVVPGIWACVNNALITTYAENNSMCAAGFTPATYKLVQGYSMPTLAQHQTFVVWYNSVNPNNGNYIRTGQKRRGGCTPETHGDLYVPNNDDWGYQPDSGWQDLFLGGPSCSKGTGSANNMSHPLAGVICVAGVYEYPQP
ncbi:MAG: hypothetical protein ABIK09_20785 [Pseudomonadota bacterium]